MFTPEAVRKSVEFSPTTGLETKYHLSVVAILLIYFRSPVEVPCTINELPLFKIKLSLSVIVKFPLTVKAFPLFMVNVSPVCNVRFPAKASVPELITGAFVTFGIVTKEEVVGTPLSQFPAKFHTVLVVPVQFVVFMVKAS